MSATLGIAHNTGYPLLVLMGKVFTFIPVGNTAYRVNLMSAVFTALAVGVVFATIDDLTDDLMAAAFGAAAAGVLIDGLGERHVGDVVRL